MVRVESYLKVGNDFIPIANFDGRISDPFYVDGAIEMEINGVQVLTVEMWDLVDQLWAYITQGLEDVATKHEWKTSFPDQPIKLSFRADERRRGISVEVFIPPDERSSAYADYDEFMTEMNEAGQRFFRRMIELVPENRASYQSTLNDLEAAMSKAA